MKIFYLLYGALVISQITELLKEIRKLIYVIKY